MTYAVETKDRNMREILFKAKRKDWRELPKEEWWFEGYYVCLEGEHGIVLPYIEWNENEQRELPVFIKIDPETLCQYTGLTDKNGNRIWENDIVRGHGNDKDLAKVVLGEFNVIDVETEEPVERAVGWHTEVIETDELSKLEPFCLSMPLTDFYIKISEFEVIGNIFNDVDLLKGE